MQHCSHWFNVATDVKRIATSIQTVKQNLCLLTHFYHLMYILYIVISLNTRLMQRLTQSKDAQFTLGFIFNTTDLYYEYNLSFKW